MHVDNLVRLCMLYNHMHASLVCVILDLSQNIASGVAVEGVFSVSSSS